MLWLIRTFRRHCKIFALFFSQPCEFHINLTQMMQGNFFIKLYKISKSSIKIKQMYRRIVSLVRRSFYTFAVIYPLPTLATVEVYKNKGLLLITAVTLAYLGKCYELLGVTPALNGQAYISFFLYAQYMSSCPCPRFIYKTLNNTNLFWQDMHTNGIFLWICPEINLSNNLVCK